MKRLLAAIVAAAAVALTAACTGPDNPDEDTAAPTPTTHNEAALWDPCTALPESALKAAGLRPETKRMDVAGVHEPGWKVCRWMADWYGISVYSNDKTVAEMQQNPLYSDPKQISVGGRAAVQLNDVDDDRRDKCNLLIATPQGSVMFGVAALLGETKKTEVCAKATQIVTEFKQYLPAEK